MYGENRLYLQHEKTTTIHAQYSAKSYGDNNAGAKHR